MDRINDYVEKMKIKTVSFGGFDKESVFMSLKELVSIFEEELTILQNENKSLQKKIVEMDQKDQNNEIINENEKLKQYVSAYQEMKRKFDQVNKEKTDLYMSIQEIKEEYQKKIYELKQYIQQLSSQDNSQNLSSLNSINDHFKQTVERLTENFIQESENILQENEKLKDENHALKEELEEYKNNKLEIHQHFIDEINQLYNSLEVFKSKYIKDDE